MPNKNAGEPDGVAEGSSDFNPAAEKSHTGLGLDTRAQEAIGRTLKAHYEDLVRAPVPNKFLELLDRLEATEQSRPEAESDGG
jgi:hypothetical protein